VCFDGAVGAARGFGDWCRLCCRCHFFVVSVARNSLLFLIVAHCRQCCSLWTKQGYVVCNGVKGMMIEMSDTADVLTMLLILLHLRCKE
jgi:hypothetical protein